MSSQTLTYLAPELLIQILESANKFADVTSLSATCRKMSIIWKTNVGAICEAILARNVLCYAQALEVIDAQERTNGDAHSFFTNQSAVDRAQWMLNGADIAAEALVEFKAHVTFYSKLFQIEERGERLLTLIDWTDFLRAFYRANTMATIGKGPLPGQLLSSWGLLDFDHVTIWVEWLANYCSLGRVGTLTAPFDYNYSGDFSAPKITLETWRDLWISMLALKNDFNDLTSKLEQAARPVPQSISPTIFLGQYDYLYKTNREFRLADLVPLVREKGVRYNVRYEISEA